MNMRRDILDEREPILGSVARSAAGHLALIGLIAGYSLLSGKVRDTFGDPNPNGGGSVLIQPVNSIPIPTPKGPVQPVANDTRSQVPERPQPKKAPPRKAAPKEDPDAIALRSKNAPKPRPVPPIATPPQPERPNQIYSPGGARTSSPLYQVQGSGGVGMAQGNPFGNRFGYYADLVRQRVARNWRTANIPQNTAPPVIVTFEVARNGVISNVRVVQRSGNTLLDYACQRAVADASPLPPLPAGFERDSADIEFWFQLQK
jgi:protein TonB